MSVVVYIVANFVHSRLSFINDRLSILHFAFFALGKATGAMDERRYFFVSRFALASEVYISTLRGAREALGGRKLSSAKPFSLRLAG